MIHRLARLPNVPLAPLWRHSREIELASPRHPAGRGEPLQHRAGLRVGGDERLQRELVERDVPGRAEVRDRRVEAQLALGVVEVQREHDVRRAGRRAALRGRGRELRQLLAQRDEARVAGEVGEAFQAVQQVPGPLGEVAHVGREAVGAQAQAVDVDRRGEHRGVEHGEQGADGAVGHHHVAAPVDDERRERFVAREEVLQRPAHRLETPRVEPRLARRSGRSRRRGAGCCARATGPPGARTGRSAAPGWPGPARSRRSSGGGWRRPRRGRGPSGCGGAGCASPAAGRRGRGGRRACWSRASTVGRSAHRRP